MKRETAPAEIRRGDIYWIHNSGPSVYDHKIRPAIIISSDAVNKIEVNGQKQDVMVVFLTQHTKYDNPLHVTIRTTEKPSVALCEKITTVRHSDIGHYMGHCSEQEMGYLDIAVSTSLGVEHPIPEMKETSANQYAEEYMVETELLQKVSDLETDVAMARHEAKIMRGLYHDLLNKTLGYKEA